MPSVTIHLPDDVYHDVQSYSKNINKDSFSATCRILIEMALKIEKLKNEAGSKAQHQKETLADKQIEYLLQSLNINKEILRCVFNSDAVRTGGDTAEANLKIIKEGTQQYIDGLLGKEM